MAGNKVRGWRTLGIAGGITALVLMMTSEAGALLNSGGSWQSSD